MNQTDSRNWASDVPTDFFLFQTGVLFNSSQAKPCDIVSFTLVKKVLFTVRQKHDHPWSACDFKM